MVSSQQTQPDIEQKLQRVQNIFSRYVEQLGVLRRQQRSVTTDIRNTMDEKKIREIIETIHKL